MGRSQRANRSPSRYNEDSRGDTHYPSSEGYIYDWSGTWPSGSSAGSSDPNMTVSGGGITLVTTLLPANAGVLQVTGVATSDMVGAVTFDSDAAGQHVIERADYEIASGDDATTVAATITTAIIATVSHLASSTAGKLDFALQGAGTINRAVLTLGVATVLGPFTATGLKYWLQPAASIYDWRVWFDVWGTADPDISITLAQLMAMDDVKKKTKTTVYAKVEKLIQAG